jgi:AcrR family transcriptional regulator
MQSQSQGGLVVQTSGIGKRRAASLEDGTATYHERRRQIMVAAAGVFNERGFHATSLAAIAEALGIDRASLYYYVGSKEELFDEVVMEVSKANVANAEAVREEHSPPPERLSKLIRMLMDSYGEYFPLLYIYIRENLKAVAGDRKEWANEMRRLNRRYDKAVIAIIQEGFDDGSIREVASAEIIAFGIIGSLNWTNRWFDPKSSKASATEIGHAYSEMLLNGLATKRKLSKKAV